MKRSFRKTPLFQIAGTALATVMAAQAADITVGTEYRYPTTYQVIYPQAQPGIIGGVQPMAIPVVQPGGFETRMVGVHLSVEATVADLVASNEALESLHQAQRRGNTPLMLAAAGGEDATVSQLLQRGTIADAHNQVGATALMGASAGGFTNIVAMLMRAGAHVNLKANNGSTALLFATRNDHADVARQLLAAGADPNLTDAHGETPLMYAVQNKYADMVQVLVKAGARALAKDAHGTSALQLAEHNNQKDLVAVLALSAAAPAHP